MGTNAVYQGRIEDDRFITGTGRYVADLRVAGGLHAVIVRSVVASGSVRAIETSDAREMPGVVAIFTAADLHADGIEDLPCQLKQKRPDGSAVHPSRRQILAGDHVRHLGEAVAVVIGETRQAALDAAELVVADIEDRPLVASTRAALAADAVKVWDEVEGNVAFLWSKGEIAATEAALAGAAHVTKMTSHVTRVMAHTMEPRGCLAYVEDGGRLVVHPSNQNPYPVRAQLANVLGLPVDQIHVKAGDVGGSFGMKSGIYPEDVLVCWAARKLGKPVRWIADRSEGFLADDHGRDVLINTELGLDADGTFIALKVACDVNIGAYLSNRSIFMIGNFGGIAGVYRIGSIAGEVRGIHTNTQMSTPYRGAGRPEATYAIERTIDMAAREMGIDPFELRMRNIIPTEAMPYDTGLLFKYDCGEFGQNMIEAARMIDRAGFEDRRQAAAARGKLRGLGIANPVEAAGGPFLKPAGDQTRIEVGEDGIVTVYSGVMSVGQGLETMLTHLVAEQLGVSPEQIRYEFGDTDNLPDGRGNGGSSSTPVGASSVSITTDNLIARGRALAAEMLGVAEDEIDFADGGYAVRGTNRHVSLAELATYAAENSEVGFGASGSFAPSAVTFPNGCHMCEVEIDPETGVCSFVDYVVVEDIGTVVNPTLARGQMHGGIAQGMGQAIGERVVYDEESGQLLTGSFMDYQMPRADDMPTVRFMTREVPTKLNPIGAKGVGEAGTVGSMVATINAICDALGQVGVEHIEMPATSGRIWEAIQTANQITKAG
jgi:aerobic carbon-monoxide dehydrogenase large subunit